MDQHSGNHHLSSSGQQQQHPNNEYHPHAHHHHTDVPASPSHFGFTGTFLAEDLQELLGAMRDEQQEGGSTSSFPGSFSHHRSEAPPLPHHHHHQHSLSNTSHHSNNSYANNDASPKDNLDRQVSTVASAAGGPPLPGDAAKAQARSERKRSRERQRRSDVNKQFSDLTELLRKIETEDHVVDADAQSSGSISPTLGTAASRFSFSPANRVDLISKTITVLERLHSANQKRKRLVGELQEELERAKKAGEDAAARLKQVGTMYNVGGSNNKIMMMVPMMVSSDVSGGGHSAAAYQMQHPFMHHAPAFCPVPQPPPATSAPPSDAAASASASASHSLHHSSTNPLPTNGVASGGTSGSSQAYPQHQHHGSYPSFLSMVPTAATGAAHAPYIFHPGMASAAMPGMAMHPDHFGFPGNHSALPSTTSTSTVNHDGGTATTDRSSTSPDATSQQESKASSVNISAGGNLAHCA